LFFLFQACAEAAGDLPREKLSNILDYEKTIHHMNDAEFKSHFRLKRGTVEVLLEKIGPHLLQLTSNGESDISPMKRILITLWILATPESYRSVANRFNVSKSSVYRALRRCVDAINSLKVIKWPEGSEAQSIIDGFKAKSGFPGVVGAIDGTHIPIMAPVDYQGSYINRKGFHSLQLQAVCQHKLKFTDCYVGQPGSVHDARVFRLSPLGQEIEGGTKLFPTDGHIIGDSAYPLSKTLLTPYRDTGNLTSMKQTYNFKHSSTRMAIERAFSHLKGRFRRLKYFVSPDLEFVVKAIMACCVLHNICIDQNDLLPADVEFSSPTGDSTTTMPQSDRCGKAKRDAIAASL